MDLFFGSGNDVTYLDFRHSLEEGIFQCHRKFSIKAGDILRDSTNSGYVEDRKGTKEDE